MTSPKIKAIRGMHDLLPEDLAYWQFLEAAAIRVVKSYGYREIRFPILEQTALFKRAIGDATDIVEKEMYTFIDRDQDSLTLRPEGTAGCVRAALEHSLLRHQTPRWWYLGPMFRHERPQKGRYRQFYQLGVEAYGMPGPDIDVELILMGQRLWQLLGLQDCITLEINTLGTRALRDPYREQLVRYFQKHYDTLDADSQRRLTTNPLRILDSKNPELQTLIAGAPTLIDALDAPAKNYFARFRQLLDDAGIRYVVNPRLVRGLDYYDHTVFEWVTSTLGAQGTVCAGGRYDTLVQQLGGEATPAIGFAAGIERLVLLLQTVRTCMIAPDIYGIFDGAAARQFGLTITERLRDALPQLSIETHCAETSFKNQFKYADKSGAQFALIIGSDELTSQTLSIKNLREATPQQRLSLSELMNYLRAHYAQ